MNNTQNLSAAAGTAADNIIKNNVLAWQATKQEAARRMRVATEAREFRANFGRVGLAFSKGVCLAA